MWAGWVHHSWRFGHAEALREVGPIMPERGSKTSTLPVVWATIGIFSARSKWLPVGRDWWPWTKLVYITMTRRQSNNHWSGGIAAHPAPKNRSAKIRWKSFRLDFLGINTASSSFIVLQKAKLSTRNITHLCWCNWRTFWRKNAAGSSPRCFVLARQCPGPPGTCNPEETDLPGLPVSWSPTLFSGSGPVGLLSVPWTEKTIEGLPFFVRSGGHCYRGDLVGRSKFWFFFEWLAKIRATG